jgi:hypothetical protein
VPATADVEAVAAGAAVGAVCPVAPFAALLFWVPGFWGPVFWRPVFWVAVLSFLFFVVLMVVVRRLSSCGLSMGVRVPACAAELRRA